METEQINIEELHPIETKIISSINTFSEFSLSNLIKLTDLTLDQVRRGLEWLKFKNIIEFDKPYNLISLDEFGRNAIKHSLPERRLVKAIIEGNLTIPKIIEKGLLTQNEINIAISKAKFNKWIDLSSSKIEGLTFKLTENFENASGEELLLNKIYSSTQLKDSDLTKSELDFLKLLIKRPKFVRIKKDEEKITLTQLGKKIKAIIDSKYKNDKRSSNNEIVTSLVADHLISGKWKNLTFRPIDRRR